MPPDLVERLFEAFYTTKGANQGTGLGLPVSAGIVRSHGGDLRYVPSPLGRGAAFTFDLPVRAVAMDQASILASVAGTVEPIADDPAAGPSTEAEVASPPDQGEPVDAPLVGTPADGSARPRVLVLDDERPIRIFLTKALTGLGFEVVATGSGRDAIEQALEAPFDAFVIDRNVGDTSGIEVYEAIVAARPDDATRFVLMSGDVLDPALEAFSAATGVGLLGEAVRSRDARPNASAACFPRPTVSRAGTCRSPGPSSGRGAPRPRAPPAPAAAAGAPGRGRPPARG